MIEIVTHCYSDSPVPIYHKLLALQINSLFSLERDNSLTIRVGIPVDIRLAICYTPDDTLTSSVVDSAIRATQNQITIRTIPLSKPYLFRRAAGRNVAALSTEADVVWFTDCDHLFKYGALKAALKEGRKIKTDSERYMIHPSQVFVNKTHKDGDYLWHDAFTHPWGEFDIPSNKFIPRREKKAIGGIQIVPGWLCRSQGYLNKTKWVEPTDSRHFLSCKGDVPFRRQQCNGSFAKDIPAVFRVRHSYAGRDQGTKDHGKK